MAEDSRPGRIERMIVRFYKFGIFIAVILILGAFFTDILTNRYYIRDVDAPVIQEILSIDDEELRNRLKDEMDHIFHLANSLKETHPNLNTVANPFSVDVGGVSTSYFTLVDFVKFKLGMPNHGISATIYADDMNHYYRTRLGSHMIEKNAMHFDSTCDMTTIFDSLMHQMAVGIVAYTDPYIASMYHYKRGEYQECIKLARVSLTKDPGARKFALGTIANTYVQLGKYDLAEEHYQKCLAEFAKFYPVYWRYGQLQEKLGRYDEAEENYLIVYRKDKRLVKPALRSLMALACTRNDSSKFLTYQKAYLDRAEIEELQENPGIAPCL